MARAYARKTDPDSSREAAEKVAVSEKEAVVLAALRIRPMTTHEIADRTGVPVVSISPRIKPLRDKGMVKDSGERDTGRSVWKITEGGKETHKINQAEKRKEARRAARKAAKEKNPFA